MLSVSCVRKLSPRGPRCFRCLMLILSGPVDFAVFNCLLDLRLSELYICGVKFAYVSVDYSALLVVCLMVFVNCLLNVVASFLLFACVGVKCCVGVVVQNMCTCSIMWPYCTHRCRARIRLDVSGQR